MRLLRHGIVDIFRSLAVKLVGAVNRERVAGVGSATMLAMELFRPLWITVLFPKNKTRSYLASSSEAAVRFAWGL
jgi:hypothetical protein